MKVIFEEDLRDSNAQSNVYNNIHIPSIGDLVSVEINDSVESNGNLRIVTQRFFDYPQNTVYVFVKVN